MIFTLGRPRPEPNGAAARHRQAFFPPAPAPSMALRGFLSAAAADAGPLVEILKQHGVDVEGASHVRTGESVAQATLRLIQDADVFIGLVAKSHPSPWVLFEAGFAMAQGIPVLILVEDEIAKSNLPDVPVLLTRLDDAKLLQSQVTSFLRGVKISPRTGRAREPAKEPGNSPIRVEPRVKDLRQRGPLMEAEIGRMLEQTGIRFINAQSRQVSGGFTHRPDFVAWIDGLDPSLNPIMIEVKAKVPATLRSDLADQMKVFLSETHCSLGLVVYDSHQSPDVSLTPAPGYPIFTISIDELQHRLQTKSLGTWLATLRNKQAHGVPLHAQD